MSIERSDVLGKGDPVKSDRFIAILTRNKNNSLIILDCLHSTVLYFAASWGNALTPNSAGLAQ